MWLSFALSAEALCAWVDCETDETVQLLPRVGETLVMPDYDTLTFEGDYVASSDLFVSFMRSANSF